MRTRQKGEIMNTVTYQRETERLVNKCETAAVYERAIRVAVVNVKIQLQNRRVVRLEQKLAKADKKLHRYETEFAAKLFRFNIKF